MKKSNKLTTAGIGLLIAAVAGMGPALASDGSTPEVGNSPLEVAALSDSGSAEAQQDTEKTADSASSAEDSSSASDSESVEAKDEATDSETANGLQVERIDEDSEASSTPKHAALDSEKPGKVAKTDSADTTESTTADEEAVSEAAPQLNTPATEKAPKDENLPEAVTKTGSDEEKTVAVAPADKPAKEAPAKEIKAEQPKVKADEKDSTPADEFAGVNPVSPVEVSPSAVPSPSNSAATEKAKPAETKPAESKPVAKKPAPKKSTIVEPTEAKLDPLSPATTTPKKKAPVVVKVVKVDYVVAPASLSTVRSTNTVGKAPATEPKPQELGPVLPLLEAASELPATQGTVNLQPEAAGTETQNGQSMVVWFELPPAEGPVLKPGDATAPLLGSAVTETAVNSNVIPASQVAPQQVPAGSTATATAAVPVANTTVAERGVMARTLARTGSLAQYAAMLSAIAMIIGVGMLIGAAAARRKQEN